MKDKIELIMKIISNPLVSSIIGGIISGIIIWIFLQRREKKKWQKAKEFIEKDWLELLQKTFVVIQSFVTNTENKWYPLFTSLSAGSPKGALNILYENFNDDIIPNFPIEYAPNILNYDKEQWDKLYINVQDLLIYGESLISRLFSFTYASPVITNRMLHWKERTEILLYFYKALLPELFDPSIEVDKVKDISASQIDHYIKEICMIAKEELKHIRK